MFGPVLGAKSGARRLGKRVAFPKVRVIVTPTGAQKFFQVSACET
jgi:archaeosine-15-forming tRNA-guanine transglycosylase